MSVPRPDFADLVATMARLRAPGGCPWDRAQTPSSLRPYLLEEAYETLDAIDAGDPDRLKEELGDLLLQVVFHAQMAAEAGAFTIDDVVAGLAEKLIRRHPHVFGTATAATPDAVVTRWEAIKEAERAKARAATASQNAGAAANEIAAPNAAEPDTGVLAGLTQTLPALMLAQQMLVRAARAGFPASADPGADGSLAGMCSALDDLAANRDAAARERGVGDLLFAAAGAARALGVDAEVALRAASERFRARFGRLEALVRERGKSLADFGPADLAVLWREAGAAG
jgi:MazG family protein